MEQILLVIAIVIILCIFLNKVSIRAGVPMLLAFIFLGMLFGTDGIFKIEMDNYALVSNICTIALIFIMFYGGFGTNIATAKPILVQASILATLGVFATAFLTGLFCYFVLKMDLITGMLMGSVIASTDAASVFAIFRSRKLGLKNNTAPLLEVESGSNDPAAYMLTVVLLKFIEGNTKSGFIISTILLQLGLGIILGFIIGYIGIYFINKIQFGTEGFNLIFVIAIAILSYALPNILGGNGYLSTYITGLIIGNARIKDKKNLVIFFDGITGLMQMAIFFLLGLLATPSKFKGIAVEAICIAIFLTIVARPLVIYVFLKPFKSSMKQILLISFAGLRGAASIVFAIMVVMNGNVREDIFDITFFIVLISILVQGSLLPWVSKKLDMIDLDEDVMKTFTDYSDELPIQFIQVRIPKEHFWVGKRVRDIELPPGTLLVYRQEGDNVSVPNGDTVLGAEDRLVISASEAKDIQGVKLTEISINKKHEYIGKSLLEISAENDSLIIIIKRSNDVIIPRGETIILENDILICNSIE